MRRERFFNRRFFNLFFVFTILLAIVYFLKWIVLGDFPVINELIFLSQPITLLSLQIPAKLILPDYFIFFDFLAIFILLIILKIIDNQLNENAEIANSGKKKKIVWLEIFLALLFGVVLSNLFGIIWAMIISIIISILIGFIFSIFVNKNSFKKIDLILDVFEPFFTLCIPMIIGIGVIYSLIISAFLVCLFLLSFFILVVIFLLISLLFLWIIEGFKIIKRRK